MALSPSIPTSFVPKQPVSTGRRRYSGGTNIFLLIAIFILVVAIVASIGVFLYSSYLDGVVNAKSAQLQTAQSNANPGTVQEFVRLRNRLSAEKTIVSQHIALSQFFTVFEGITLQDVHYDSLTVSVANDRSAKIQISGTAATFNALAAESTAFASSKYVKSAIFSDIKVNSNDNSVAFSISADLDPSIVIESAAPTTPALISTTTPVVAPATPSTTGTTTPVTTTPAAAKTTATTTPKSAAASSTPASPLRMATSTTPH